MILAEPRQAIQVQKHFLKNLILCKYTKEITQINTEIYIFNGCFSWKLHIYELAQPGLVLVVPPLCALQTSLV